MNLAPTSKSHRLLLCLLTLVGIAGVAVLLVGFNGGIGVGSSNHAGLLPVVRRLLDPNYLPGDFNIGLRLNHHRVFAYLVAGASALLGEERGIIVLHSCGALLLSFALWYLCRSLGLGLFWFVLAALMIVTHLLWSGLGLEENTFVGNLEIQPPLFAHAFVLLATALIIKQRWRWAAAALGAAVLFHLQIGVTFTLACAPFFALQLRRWQWREPWRVAGCYLLTALPALINLAWLLRGGVLRPAASAYSLAAYIDFRHPHHFELMSARHGWMVFGAFTIQTQIWLWRRRAQPDAGRGVGVLAAVSAMLWLLALVHFADYYLLRQGKIASLQMIRLSPIITVFGALCFLVVAAALARRARQSRRRWLAPAIYTAMLLLVAPLAVWQWREPGSEVRFGIVREADKRSNWVRMCNWIAAHGPRDAGYLTPPASDAFTALTHRSNVVEFKINPDGASGLAEWFARLTDLAGGQLPRGRGFENRKLLNQAYGQLTAPQLLELGRKYGARYAVVPKDSPVTFEVLHENTGLRLVKLPGT